jgi:hypothetical protein
MSGPIIRKYGFPNFEKIFGERPIEHGVEESEQPGGQAQQSGATRANPANPAASKKDSDDKNPRQS